MTGVKGNVPLLFLVDNIVGTAGNLQGLGMLLNERVDVTHPLLLKDFVNGNEDARLFDFAKAIVNCRAEEFHGGRQAHISIDQRRNVVAQLADFAVQNTLICIEIILTKQRF